MPTANLCRLTLLVMLGVVLTACGAFERRAPDSKRSISRLEWVTLGGFPQAIRIRGDDPAKNPVLLFVHGGPGLPEMPVAHLNADLERSFTVVQWDQRGAGKSYRADTPNLNAGQIVNDALELSRFLKNRFGGRKIYLAGFSWGSLVSARAVAREPGLFAAYIGISQVVNMPAAQSFLYREAVARARARELAPAIRDLERIGPPPWTNSEDTGRGQYWWKKLAAPVPTKITPLHFAALAFTSPAYAPLDYLKVVRGLKLSDRQLDGEIFAADLFHEIPRLEVPVWFLMGRHDTTVSAPVLARYFQALQAPRGKHLVWFDRADHAPHLEDPLKYRATMREILKETSRP